MLHRLEKIVGYLSYLWRAKKRWSWPKESDVLIFDACGAELLQEHLLDWSVEVLPVRGESISIPVLLASLFAKGKKSDAYFDVYIRKVKPRLVLTFIDNTLAFYRLSGRHPGVKTMFIQNGLRGYHIDIFEQMDALLNSDEKFCVDYMLCFGQGIGGHYQRYVSGSVVAMGALRNNRQMRADVSVQGSLAYVSQWLPSGVQIEGRIYTQDEFVGAVDRCILEVVCEYVREHGKQLHIIPRTQSGSADREAEARHFTSIVGANFRFLEYEIPGSSYRAIDASDVIVGVDSTLLYEAVARGVKTAIFSIRGSLLGIKGFDFGWPAHYPADGAFWTNAPSFEKFRAVLDYLFSVSDDAWQKELESVRFDDLMRFDQGNSVLKRTLEKVLVA